MQLNSNSQSDAGAAFISMEDAPDLEYEVPRSTPHILVDQLGFMPDSKKTAIFYGQDIPDSFRVCQFDTGNIEYEGKLKIREYSNEYEANVAIGDFSDVKANGHYYIEADSLGQSFDFYIDNNIYEDVFNEACKTYYYNRCGITLTDDLANENAHNACHTDNAILRDDITVSLDVTGGWHQDSTGSKDIESSTMVLSDMLLAYELFPLAFSDDTGIPESNNGIPDILDEAKYEIDWFLKMQNKETGAVYSGVTVGNGQNNTNIIYVETPTCEASCAFAYAVAKFSYLYQDFDKDYATTCIKASDRAYQYSMLNDDNQDSEYRLSAAAEIYRASAKVECKDYIESWFNEKLSDKSLDTFDIYGCFTYINTKQNVDIDICNSITKIIMKRAEDISELSRNSLFQVPTDLEQTNNSKLLKSMTIMTLVDHIIPNAEYDTIIENYLHYFLGKNVLAISYVDNAGTYSYKDVHEALGLMKQFNENARFIFLLSRIISNDGFVEE